MLFPIRYFSISVSSDWEPGAAINHQYQPSQPLFIEIIGEGQRVELRITLLLSAGNKSSPARPHYKQTKIHRLEMVIDRHQHRAEAFYYTHTLTSMPQQGYRQVSVELRYTYVLVCKEERKLEGVPLQTELCISTK